MIDNDFESIKEKVINLIKNKNEITSKTNYKIGGIYMLYVDNFENNKIIPFYIGKTHNFQERHKEHMKEIFAINRLDKDYYEYTIINNYFTGNYKSCKIFKYMIDNNCVLKDIHMIIVEEIESEEIRIKQEQKYINEYLASYFGFNQLNSITFSMEVPLRNDYIKIIENDLLNIKKYIKFGFNEFNYLLAKEIFESKNNKLLEDLKELEEIKEIDNNVELGKKVVNERLKLREFNDTISKEKCKRLCGKYIDDFFMKNELKSEEKKKQIINGLLFDEEKNKNDVLRYIQRFSAKDKINIFNTILEKEYGEEIKEISQKIEENKKEIEELGYKIYSLRKKLFKGIIPQNHISKIQLQDLYEEKDIFEGISKHNDNVLYINIEYSNHGRRTRQEDYPFEVKVDYILFKNKEEIRKTYFIESSSSLFFKEDYYYVIEKSWYNIHNVDPFRIGKRGGKIPCYSTISTSMEYDNGINEFTLKDKETRNFISVVKELDELIDNETKIIYTSSCKSLIKRFKDSSIENESLLIKKLIKLV